MPSQPDADGLGTKHFVQFIRWQSLLNYFTAMDFRHTIFISSLGWSGGSVGPANIHAATVLQLHLSSFNGFAKRTAATNNLEFGKSHIFLVTRRKTSTNLVPWGFPRQQSGGLIPPSQQQNLLKYY